MGLSHAVADHDPNHVRNGVYIQREHGLFAEPVNVR